MHKKVKRHNNYQSKWLNKLLKKIPNAKMQKDFKFCHILKNLLYPKALHDYKMQRLTYKTKKKRNNNKILLKFNLHFFKWFTTTQNLNFLLIKKLFSNTNQISMLKGEASLIGFKKALYNRIKINNYRLEPAYNRRKHSLSHYILLNNQYSKLSKSFGYLSKNKIDFFIGAALKKTYKNFDPNFIKSNRAIPHLVTLIETDSSPILYRNMFSNSLAQAKHVLRHRLTQRNKAYVFILGNLSNYKTKITHNYTSKSMYNHINKKWLHFGEIMRFYNPLLKN